MSRAETAHKAQQRREHIAAMWEAGLSMNQMADELRTTRGGIAIAIARMRHAGWKLSYRRPAYAAVPFEYGSWEERRAAMAANSTRRRPSIGWGGVLRADPCAYCGRRRSSDVDHIVPVARGGEFGSSNLIGACKSCNSSKQARSLLLFLALRHIDAERAAWLEIER